MSGLSSIFDHLFFFFASLEEGGEGVAEEGEEGEEGGEGLGWEGETGESEDLRRPSGD